MLKKNIAESLKEFQEAGAYKPLLLLLLLGDLVFVIIHVFHKLTQHFANALSHVGMDSGHAAFYQSLNSGWLQQLTPYLANPMFNIEMDNGFAETYQHFKFATIILLFTYLCLKRNIWSFVPWVLLFAYFLLDDAFQLHERLGSVIASGLSMPSYFGLRKQDLGELSVTAAAGLLILPSLLLAYYWGRPALRKIFHNLGLLLVLLVAFGVGVDMVHVVFMNHSLISPILALVEDGGEMLAISLFVWYVFSLTKRRLDIKVAVRQLAPAPLLDACEVPG
ncbi:hypothetical protein [Massilia suwonensis]|uniref:Uncharacterized protein n=1 Tax=Massilia suwonensis TaxID=648895 RepID=A0ABW0MRF0_9BURK